MHDIKEYCIDIEMSDGGKRIAAAKANDFLYKPVIRTAVMKTQERVAGLLCPVHHNFPITESAISDRGLVVIRVRCCCQEFLTIVDTRFHAK